MGAGKMVALVAGSLVLLVGIGILFLGGTLTWVSVAFTDDEGFLTLPAAELERDAYAVAAQAEFEDDWVWWYRHPTTVRVRITGEQPVFVGIASRTDLAAYLSDVSYAEIERIDFDDYRTDRLWTASYEDHVGTNAPAPPADQAFWRASAQGEGAQTLTWQVEPGDWMLVVMNADGSRGLRATGTVGAQTPWLLGVGIGLLVAGIVLGGISLALVLVVARRLQGERPQAPVEPSQPMAPGGFPLVFKGELTEPLSPSLWLVKWLLIIPHLVVLFFLWAGFCLSWIMSFFAILFTGRYPRGLFDYNVGVMRWTWRVAFYSYQALGTDQYPPFTLQAGGYPADLDVSYPEQLSQGLVLVKWWLLAIPHYIVVGIFQGGAGFFSWGLVTILTIFAGITLLFTGAYPKDFFRMTFGMNRWAFRTLAYAALMTDRYPPFRLDS